MMALYKYDILYDKYHFFCATLVDKLHDFEPSISIYFAKSSRRINVTSSNDFFCCSHDIVRIFKLRSLYWCLRNHLFNDCIIHRIDGFWLHLIQKKGNQYDYILFDLA